jgi:hypothetical protein
MRQNSLLLLNNKVLLQITMFQCRERNLLQCRRTRKAAIVRLEVHVLSRERRHAQVLLRSIRYMPSMVCAVQLASLVKEAIHNSCRSYWLHRLQCSFQGVAWEAKNFKLQTMMMRNLYAQVLVGFTSRNLPFTYHTRICQSI